MKKLIFLFSFFLILFIESFSFHQNWELKGTISLSGAWAIYPTAVAWAEAFQRKNPGVNIEVSAGGAGKGVADLLAGFVDIGMVSRDPSPSELEKGIFPVLILHDAVFPIISEKNPFFEEIVKKGIKREIFIALYEGKIKNWDDVIGKKVGKPVHVYTRSDSCGAGESWAKYLGKKQEDLKGIGVYGDPGILTSVSRDPLGIGYSNFSYVFERDGSILKGIKLVPIDSNNNGIAEKEEVYNKREEASKAINQEKYPVRRKNYFFTKGKPKGLLKDFIIFVLSDEGTRIVEDIGTSLPLPKEEREKVLRSLE
jgi:phosphate transport system substrate-binding protein